MSEEIYFELISYKLQYMHNELVKAGLPVLSVRLDKTIEWSVAPTAQQVIQANNILSTINLNTLTDVNKTNIINEYQNAITRLEQIRDADPLSLTNILVINAIKDIAKYQVILLKYIKRVIV